MVLQLKKPNILQLYPVAIVSGCTVSGCSFHLYPVTARPPKKPNCIRLHCIRLQKNLPCCNCIRLQCIRLQLYPVATVSGCISRGFALVSPLYPCIRLQLYLVKCYELYLSCISKSLIFSHCIRLQLYPVALYPVAVFACLVLQPVWCCNLPFAEPRYVRRGPTMNWTYKHLALFVIFQNIHIAKVISGQVFCDV